GLGELPAGDARRLRQRRTDLLDPVGVRCKGDEVRLREVAVVLRLLLAAPWAGGAGVLVEVPGLLHDADAAVEKRTLPLDLVAHGALDGAQRVDVLGLRPGAQLAGTGGCQRDVDVAAKAPLLHPY